MQILLRNRIAEDFVTFPGVAQGAVEGQKGIKVYTVKMGKGHGGPPGGDADLCAACLKAAERFQRLRRGAVGVQPDEGAVNIKKRELIFPHLL